MEGFAWFPGLPDFFSTALEFQAYSYTFAA
jgi:hypothetical protein